MAKTPFLEKTGSIRALGAAFVAMMVFFVWLTFAFFNKTFVANVPVTLTTTNAGTSLPSNADVKLRGMIVGEVRDISPDGTGIKIKIAMKPDAAKIVPRDVTAQIVPKTLFGEKYIDLLPSASPNGETIQAGDNISKAVVPIEIENLLNDLYPLLEAVQPAELSYTLTAVSDALEGRGEQLGSTLVTANDYLKELNPEVPQLIDDAVKLGQVSDVYAGAMPELGRLLENLVVTGDTIVAKRAQLQAFFSEGTKLADTTSAFLKDNGDNIITLTKEGRPVLEVISDYSKTFPCVLKGVTDITPKLDNAFRNDTLHIKLIPIALQDQPTGYTEKDRADLPSKATIDALAKPKSDGTPGIAAANCTPTEGEGPYSRDNIAPTPPLEVYELLGIEGDHNKFGKSRVAATSESDLVDLVGSSIDGVDTASQRSDLNKLLGASLGMSAKDVPDLGSLLVSPIIRGSGVSLDEAR